MTNEYRHIPVLLTECLSHIQPKPGFIFVDATLGGAGHSFEIAKRLGKDALVIGIDQDDVAIAAAGAKLMSLPEEIRPQIKILKGNFSETDRLLTEAEIPHVDAFLFDLGVSSVQIDTPERGFSFKEDGPLDMRMAPSKQTLTAQEIINTYNAADLTRIIRDYSDEKWASRIAKFIVEARSVKPITTSFELVEIIKAAIPASARRLGGHPAKRTFQALRIEVNGELDALQTALDAAIKWLSSGGIIEVISYHSLEDRIVKDTFNRYIDRCVCPPDLPVCTCGRMPILTSSVKKPILPTDEELHENPRSRSAKLRIATRV
ncbi:MAG: 16S rRNA (cytosine(1402)-N(4))-methyltransferase RsmH [Eggerthellaceae bacterium]|nr:16S rRNA (cytosine(1402)-N(4))-methyltransferase RsmH [Eggerthellaceae bacterium]